VSVKRKEGCVSVKRHTSTHTQSLSLTLTHTIAAGGVKEVVREALADYTHTHTDYTRTHALALTHSLTHTYAHTRTHSGRSGRGGRGAGKAVHKQSLSRLA